MTECYWQILSFYENVVLSECSGDQVSENGVFKNIPKQRTLSIHRVYKHEKRPDATEKSRLAHQTAQGIWRWAVSGGKNERRAIPIRL